jgi:hypothetical protein
MAKKIINDARGLNRHRQWRATFLTHLGRIGVVSTAAEAAGLSRNAVYEHRTKDKDFAAAWDDALQRAADVLEAEAFRRAVEGVERHVVQKGAVVFVGVDKDGRVLPDGDPAFVRMVPLIEREYSDQLLTLKLKAARPEKFRDHHHVEHTGIEFKSVAEGSTEAARLLAALTAKLEVGR